MSLLRIGRALALAGAAAGAPAGAAGQDATRWLVEARTSLAWWQIDPHYEHLWATTCPDDPSWQAGEGRSPRYSTNYRTRPVTIPSGRSEPRIPLFPRLDVRPLCRRAVRGEVTVADTLRWSGVRGAIVVLADSLVTGLDLRDAYARKAVFETEKHPELKFTIDSLVEVLDGDTVRGVAVGVFEVRGYAHPIRVPVTAVREAGGLRVRGQSSFDAQMLVNEFSMSRWALGMGVVFKRWKTVHWGIDLIVQPDTSGRGAT
jgi:hypothetical protein